MMMNFDSRDTPQVDTDVAINVGDWLSFSNDWVQNRLSSGNAKISLIKYK